MFVDFKLQKKSEHILMLHDTQPLKLTISLKGILNLDKI